MKLINKISAIALGLAMAAGVGASVSHKSKEVHADEKTPIVIDPSYLQISGNTTAETTFTATDGLYYIAAPCGKDNKINSQSIAKTAANRLSSNGGIMIGKNGAYLYNTSAMPFDIVSVDVYATTGCSTKVSVSVDFGTTAVTSKGEASSVTLNTTDTVFTFDCASEGCKYFRFNVTNANNAQVQLRINFEKKALVSVTGVELDSESISLLAGRTEQLVATVSPKDATDQTVSWESSDSSVATVDENGVIRAIKPGSTTITVKTTDGEETDSCVITVVNNDYLKDTLDITTLKMQSSYPATDVASNEFDTGSKFLSNGTINNKTNIQLRSSDASGIVSSKTAGFVKAVRVDAASGDKVYDVYGSNTAYTSAANLYDASLKGTKIGSGKGTSTIVFEENYQYVGIRSNNGAIYLADIIVEWEPVKPASISLAATSSSTVTVENTETIIPTFVNEDYVVTATGLSWESDNTGVATVSDGVVTAVSAGKATITATSTANTNVKGTIEITVSNETIHVESISLSPTTLEMVDGQQETLTATVSPANASNKSVTWSSDKPGVATVANGVVTAVSGGDATITATTTDSGKTATCKVSVTMRERMSFELVTDEGMLTPGAQYIFVSSHTVSEETTYYSMIHYGTGSVLGANVISEPQSSLITEVKDDILSSLYVLGGESGKWTFANGEKYLFASGTSSSKNQLKEGPTLDDKAKWSIEFGQESVATINANASEGNKLLCFNYNAGNPRFACYAATSTTILSPQLYKLVPQEGTAEAYATKFLNRTGAVCAESGDHETSLQGIWTDLAEMYNELGSNEQAKILAEEPSSLIKSMLERYDYIVAKYSLENFITGHEVSPLNNRVYYVGKQNNDNAVTIIAIVSVVSVTCLGVLVTLKKRKTINK